MLRVINGKGYTLVKVLDNPNKGVGWKQNKAWNHRIRPIFSYAEWRRRTTKHMSRPRS